MEKNNVYTEEIIKSQELQFRERVNSICGKVLNRQEIRFLTLSGPSCSGKTTTAKIISENLGRQGHKVSIISIDDFYRDRDDIIAECKRKDVPIDMDSITSIDLKALERFITSIQQGKRALLPKFDFVAGKRHGYKMFWPNEKAIYLFEGIQAVYPEVTELIGKEGVLTMYISVEKEIDACNTKWNPRDVRLLRRLLRDSLTRGTSAERTLSFWGSVTKNELLNIEPYKDFCDEKIDSGMTYEIGVMKEPLTCLLSTVKEGEDHAVTARLLSEKLSGVDSIPSEYVPDDSVLREFIGSKQ